MSTLAPGVEIRNEWVVQPLVRDYTFAVHSPAGDGSDLEVCHCATIRPDRRDAVGAIMPTTDYTLVMNEGGEGGTISLLGEVFAGDTYAIYRTTEITRASSFTSAESVRGGAVEAEFARTYRLLEEVSSEAAAAATTGGGSTVVESGDGLSEAEVDARAEAAAEARYTDTEKTKLAGIEDGAKDDQTGQEMVEAIDTHLGGTDWQSGGTGGTATPLSNDTPSAPGAAAAGTSTAASRSDHVHRPMSGGEIAASLNVELGTTTWRSRGLSDEPATALGEAAAGSSIATSRADHVHPLPAAVTTAAAGLMLAADKTKLDGVEVGATGDQSDSEIQAAVGSTSNLPEGSNLYFTNSRADARALLRFTAAEKTKLAGIEAGATTDQSGSEIVSAIDSQLGNTTWQTGGGGGGGTTPLSDAVPQSPGTAAAGSASAAARGDHVHPLPAEVTTAAAGLMSAADKTKLDGVEAGADANRSIGDIASGIDLELGSNQWRSRALSSASPSAPGAASAGSSLQTSRSDHVHPPSPAATTAAPGLMSAADKTKLAGIEVGATGDQSDSEIQTAVGSTSNVPEGTNLYYTDSRADARALLRFTAAEKTKLGGIEANAKDDQTAAEIVTALETLSGAARLNATAIRNLPSGSGGGGSGGSGPTNIFTSSSSAGISFASTGVSLATTSDPDDYEVLAIDIFPNNSSRQILFAVRNGSAWPTSNSAATTSRSGFIISDNNSNLAELRVWSTGAADITLGIGSNWSSNTAAGVVHAIWGYATLADFLSRGGGGGSGPEFDESFITVDQDLETAGTDATTGTAGLRVRRGGGNNDPELQYDRADDLWRLRYPGQGASHMDLHLKDLRAYGNAQVDGTLHVSGVAQMSSGLGNQFLALNAGHATGRTGGIEWERGSADADKRYLAHNHSEDRFEFYKHGSGGFSDIKCANIIASRISAPAVPQIMKVKMKGVLDAQQPWTTVPLSILYPNDRSADRDYPANAPEDPAEENIWGDPVPAGLNPFSDYSYRQRPRFRSRNSASVLRKILWDSLYYSTSGSSFIPGASLNEADAVHGDVDVDAGEYKYSDWYNYDENNNIIPWETGELHDEMKNLEAGAVWTLSPGKWRIIYQGWGRFSPYNRLQTVYGAIDMVRPGTDDLLIAEASSLNYAFIIGDNPEHRTFTMTCDTGLIILEEETKVYMTAALLNIEETVTYASSGGDPSRNELGASAEIRRYE